MNLRQRLLRIERDVATHAARSMALAARAEHQLPKRQHTVDELHAAFEQYFPNCRQHAQAWIAQYARLGTLPTFPTQGDE